MARLRRHLDGRILGPAARRGSRHKLDGLPETGSGGEAQSIAVSPPTAAAAKCTSPSVKTIIVSWTAPIPSTHVTSYTVYEAKSTTGTPRLLHLSEDGRDLPVHDGVAFRRQLLVRGRRHLRVVEMDECVLKCDRRDDDRRTAAPSARCTKNPPACRLAVAEIPERPRPPTRFRHRLPDISAGDCSIAKGGLAVALLEQDDSVLSRSELRDLEELRRWSDNGRAVALRVRMLAARLIALGVPIEDVAEAMGMTQLDTASVAVR